MPDLTGHLTARADDSHATPLSLSGKPFRLTIILLSPLVRFSVLSPIKPHAAPLMCSPANSFKFHPCERTPQVARLSISLRHGSVPTNQPTSSGHRLQRGLPGYLIPIAPHAFIPYRRSHSSLVPSPSVVPLGSTDFTLTPKVPQTSPGS